MITTDSRVRFAPSPTGLLHVGNARTALYNWLFARRTGGKFLLRIEDTDLERSEARYETQLMEDLRWLGLNWDEGPGLTALERASNASADEKGEFGPYRQSERLEIYARYTEQLLAQGKAYRCFCTPEELEAEREQAVAEHRPQNYSGRCRALSEAEIEKNLAAGKPFAVRLKIGQEPLRFHDMVRGEVEFAAEAVSDPILVRSIAGGAAGVSAGIPVYNYVVTVDDALMGITHVIRGDDHLSNTPKQVAIYQAFGWPVPEFAHLSTILGADRERLSKRHGATSISTFREMGYLPEALVNYLALLGWGAEDGKTETFTLDELTKAFSLERVTPSPAIFDFDKLNWLNRHYLKQAAPEQLAALSWSYFEVKGTGLSPYISPANESGALAPGECFSRDSSATPSFSNLPAPIQVWFTRLLALFVPAVDHLDQLPEKAALVFGFDPAAARANEENAAVLAAPSADVVLKELTSRVRAHEGPVTPEVFKIWMNEIKAATKIKGKELFHPVRIALTGTHSGPEFDKLIPLIEDGAALGLGVRGVRERMESFAGE
jgi:nondiscriminating glutamyl-tRNA synthetase